LGTVAGRLARHDRLQGRERRWEPRLVSAKPRDVASQICRDRDADGHDARRDQCEHALEVDQEPAPPVAMSREGRSEWRFAPHTAMTIFPWACPSPWRRRASGTSLKV
jgi:hypothetical protein